MGFTIVYTGADLRWVALPLEMEDLPCRETVIALGCYCAGAGSSPDEAYWNLLRRSRGEDPLSHVIDGARALLSGYESDEVTRGLVKVAGLIPLTKDDLVWLKPFKDGAVAYDVSGERWNRRFGYWEPFRRALPIMTSVGVVMGKKTKSLRKDGIAAVISAEHAEEISELRIKEKKREQEAQALAEAIS